MRLPWIAAARDAADAEPALAPAIGGPDRERALIALWERHLGVTPIDLDDDFFDLGGNSLLAVSMLRALEAILGRRLSPDILLRAPTIRMLSAAATEARALRHLVPVRGPTRETAVDLPPLVLVHPIGGEVLVYRAVVERLEPGRAVYGLRFGAADIGHGGGLCGGGAGGAAGR
jgi:acyl carrier protein